MCGGLHPAIARASRVLDGLLPAEHKTAMSRDSLGLPSSVGEISSAWLADEELRLARALSFRAQRRRNSSFSSLSTVSEHGASSYAHERRGSAPAWSDVNRFLQARRCSQTLPDREWTSSSRRGSLPVTGLDWDSSEQLQPYGIAKHIMEKDRSRMMPRRQSLPNGDPTWGESTMTMDATTSLGTTFNGRQLKFKIILLGDCGVGKTSFLQTLLHGKFTTSVSSSNLAYNNVVRTVEYNGLDVHLHFNDTAGQERYRSITASYYRHAQGCLVFFNINLRSSFEHIESWLDDLNKYGKRDNMAVVLVGLTHKLVRRNHKGDQTDSTENVLTSNTKSWSDLDNDSVKTRAVPRAQAEHLASSCKIPYVEADICNDPCSVSDTVYKLLDLLMWKAVKNEQKAVSIVPKHKKPSSMCCNYC